MKEKPEISHPKQARAYWSGEVVRTIPVPIGSQDYATRLDRIARTLYPYFTSSANPLLTHSIIETKTVGSFSSEEVSEHAETKPAA